jgi:hypothetical protein
VFGSPHRPLLAAGLGHKLARVDDRLFRAGLLGAAK